MRLRLQPHVTLLALDYAVDDFLIAVKKHALRAEASNAPSGPHTGRARAVLPPRRERIYVAVHRHDNRLFYKRLDPAGYRLLVALRGGQTLAGACARVLPKKAAATPAWQNRIREWFQTWAHLGWFCRR